jgi:hypothetical protein
LKTLDELFCTIMSIPFVDTNIKTRAGYLRTQVCKQGRGYDLYRMFGF